MASATGRSNDACRARCHGDSGSGRAELSTGRGRQARSRPRRALRPPPVRPAGRPCSAARPASGCGLGSDRRTRKLLLAASSTPSTWRTVATTGATPGSSGRTVILSPTADAAVLVGRHHQLDAQRIDHRHAQQRLFLDALADVDEALDDDAGERAAHRAQRQLGLGDAAFLAPDALLAARLRQLLPRQFEFSARPARPPGQRRSSAACSVSARCTFCSASVQAGLGGHARRRRRGRACRPTPALARSTSARSVTRGWPARRGRRARRSASRPGRPPASRHRPRGRARSGSRRAWPAAVVAGGAAQRRQRASMPRAAVSVARLRPAARRRPGAAPSAGPGAAVRAAARRAAAPRAIATSACIASAQSARDGLSKVGCP